MEPLSVNARTVLSKFGFATPQEAVWTCPTCGEVAPRLIESIVRYMRGSCVCQQVEQERRRQAERIAELKAREAHRRQMVYGWLGERWTCEELASRTFANFEQANQPRAYDATLAFADIMEGSLILFSPSFGTGKTHLLAALCQEMTARGTRCLFTTAPKLFAAIQSHIGRSEDYTYLIEKAVNTPLLVLDDVDKAKWSEFREEIYFEIIDSRVNARRPIALSTNKLDGLANYVGGACCSRLSVGQIAMEMVGADYRVRL